MQTTKAVRAIAAALSVTAVALALMGAAWRGEPAPATTAPPAVAVTPMVGVPTGEFVNGIEVQRLPSITVTARRSDAQ